MGTVGGLWYSFAMADHVAAALDKMRAAGAHPAELAAMTRRLEQLDDPDAGRLSGDVLEPLGWNDKTVEIRVARFNQTSQPH